LDKFIIKGGRRLEGEVTISGAKNAVVAIIPAVILTAALKMYYFRMSHVFLKMYLI